MKETTLSYSVLIPKKATPVRVKYLQVACLYNHIESSVCLVPCSETNSLSPMIPNGDSVFFRKQTHLASPRPTHFIDGTSTVRFMEQNLVVPESNNNREVRKSAPIVPKQRYLNLNPGAASYQIKRKSPSHATQKPARTMNKRASNHDSSILLPPLHIRHSPDIPHRTIRFEDFVPEHKLKTWREMDDEERRGARTNSLSILIANIVDKVRYQVRKMTRYTRL
ncbi:hypothetical protein COCC4DRAFT_122690 [Bipolaris maydis ATCC 48331]|uniref:Uncharacterized protein n=2 Tax=Cochliobolus heterostrophus TaxID=5016 RepID=M2V913_COCH5|nr:uncharacterized protein COCC4DRAFT_122690 [Bipolaris maydis ATCC 48331]EMD96218.1 hypothetical protein COCHEDRAFT_1210436 [Bipolaris maydis C5]KAH7562059.1 hypothetical protein BM1_03163 [Bipolaris maydis]ENI11077.1 hypothetical protein COCC4DRAFT_122690 [Bipolaris maydis ATCC 48331]KAJ5030883.1 hypothetical protein J3E73DRAFT_366230 [Bipolaris maydis]KAJ6213022.1 hypothetical protein PSV09DRAFT_1210436 [Bipolaris maydis]